MTNLDITTSLNAQLTDHWQRQLRPRLDGLTDDEYFWEPVPQSWNVRPRGQGIADVEGGSGDFIVDFSPAPADPPPVTTIAWRLVHVIVGIFGARNHAHFDGPSADYLSWPMAGTADEALHQLDETYDHWVHGVATLDADALAAPCGPAEGPWADRPTIDLVLHINREAIHHGAEISLLRDLYAHRKDTP